MQPESSTLRSARRELVAGVVVTVLAVIVWYARAPFAVNRLWAEDGRNWLQDALQAGPIESFGRADVGYYHSIPRVGSAIASLVPLRQAAVATWIFGAAVVAWFVITVFVSSRTWLPHWLARATLALALVLLPVQREETIGSVANLHFIMLFVGLIVLISEPRSTLERLNGSALLLLLGLSTPIALALVPFAAWRVFRRHPWRADGLTIAWLIGVVVQFSAIVVFRPERPTSEGTTTASIGARYVTGVLAENFSPTDRATRAVGLALGVGLLALVAAAVVVARRRRDVQRVVLMIAVPTVGVGTYVISAAGYGARFRYALFPALCLLWVGLCAVQTLSGMRRAPSWATGTVLFGTVAALLLVAWLPHWSASSYRRSGPSWSQGLDDAAARCAATRADEVEVVISPTDLEPGRGWSVRVDCADLIDSEGT